MVMENRFFRWMIFRGKTLWVYLRHSFFEGLRANVFKVFGEWKGKSVVLLQANMLGEFGRERLGLH